MEMVMTQNQQNQQYKRRNDAVLRNLENQQHQSNTDAAMRNLENQLGQIAKYIGNNNQGGTFTANTETNPKEHCKSITTRSGKEIGKGIGDNLEIEEAVVESR
ncbi:hypothetical protein A2U01_0061673, partial [Trifolium medium]|nr:hypothetical protein [Trifolium medium]